MKASRVRVACAVIATVAIATVGHVTGTVARQDPAKPKRDPAPLVTGTGLVAGVVVSDDATPRPIARALVTLGGSDIRTQPATLTSEDGAFVFMRIPAGRYTLKVSKAGFVTNYFGARRPGVSAQALPIVLDEGQRIDNVRLVLPKGAVITGTYRDQYGRPQPDTPISAIPVGAVGLSLLAPGFDSATARTDDRGVYRLFGLTPGSYYVAAVNPGSTMLRTTTADEVRWAQQRGGDPPAPSAPVSFAPVFFPGTTDRQAATVVALAAGEERGAVDFALRLVPSTKVTGVVLMPDGQPALGGPGKPGPEVRQRSAVLLEGEPAMMMLQRPSNGQLSLTLTPGRYIVSARISSVGSNAIKPTAEETSLWAEQEIVVDGQESMELTLRLQPGVTLKGRIVLEGSAPPLDFSRVAFTVTPGVAVDGSLPFATANSDGTFSVLGIAPGQYRLAMNASLGRSKWSLRTATLKGQNILDRPFEIRAGQNIDDVVVTFSDHPSSISGTLRDADNHPVSDYHVMLFSVDRSLWGPRSRFVRMPVRPDSSGRFTVADVPAGEYYLCALTDFEPNGWSDPAWLEQLVVGSIKVTIAVGEDHTQDLRVSARFDATTDIEWRR